MLTKYTRYTKQNEATGNVLVIAEGIGCVAVCVDDGHADYVMRMLKRGKYKLGKKGLELAHGNQENENK